ncbi:MAG: ABC transporter permease [Microcystaceae cyanobacterium]
MSILRIWAIAANGFREVIRDRILYVIGFFTLVMAFGFRVIPELAVGADAKIILDLGMAATSFLGAIVAIFVGTGLINKEIEKRTVLVMIAKPISRLEFIIGKHLGLMGVLAIVVTMMTAIYIGMISWANMSGWAKIDYSLVSILVAQVFLLLELAIVTAFALVFGVFTSSILATLLSFGVYLMGHISSALLRLGQISKNESIEALTKGLYVILPNLDRFNLKNDAIYGILPSSTDLLQSVVYAILYTVLLLTAAILIFSRRQF